MNKIGLHATLANDLPIDETGFLVEANDIDRSHRLVVLVSPEMDCVGVTRRICKIAHETHSDILLLGLYKDHTQEFSLQRELITASALIRNTKIYVEIMLQLGTDWLDAVKQQYQEGDRIVCISDQSVGIRHKPLTQILETNFRAPIYLLSDAKPQQNRTGVISQLFVWSGLIGIIILFFILQAQLVGLPDSLSKTVFSVLLLIPEILLIVFWNSLF
jgi:hypothetical protein